MRNTAKLLKRFNLICPTGKSVRFAELPLSSPLAKNISLSPSGKSSLQARPVPTR
jgi:hypothetical protein